MVKQTVLRKCFFFKYSHAKHSYIQNLQPSPMSKTHATQKAVNCPNMTNVKLKEAYFLYNMGQSLNTT